MGVYKSTGTKISAKIVNSFANFEKEFRKRIFKNTKYYVEKYYVNDSDASNRGGGGGSGTKLQTQGRWGGSIFGRDAV